MTFPKNNSRSYVRHTLLFTAWVVAFGSLSGCATPPPQAAAGTTTPVAEEPILPQPPEQAPLVCPEPEPVPAVVCPPPPKPKPCPVCPAAKVDGKLLVGTLEYVKITPPGITYEARMNSGSELTTLQVANLVRFERDGEKWVKFDLEGTKGETVTVERQVLRRVKASRIDREGTGRYLVVMMSMAIGSVSEQVEMVLVTDSPGDESVSIGRNFLHNNAIVDVSQKFIVK